MVPFKWIDLLSSPQMEKWASIDMIPDSVMDVFDGKTWTALASVRCGVRRNPGSSFTGALQSQSNIICVAVNTRRTCLKKKLNESLKNQNHPPPQNLFISLWAWKHLNFCAKNNLIRWNFFFNFISSLIFFSFYAIFIPLSAAFHSLIF